MHTSIKEGLLENSSGEDNFYACIRVPNGTWKTTTHGRFTDLDQWLVGHLPRNTGLRVLDVGISSAITTVDLDTALRDNGISPEIVGIDLFPDANMTTFGPITVLSEGSFIYQVDCGPLRFPNAMFQRNRLAIVVKIIAKLVLATRTGVKIPFICREAQSRGVIIIREDIIGERFLVGGTRFQLVRAMNILNAAYFSEADLVKAIRNLHSVLDPHGMILVGRSEQDRAMATLFGCAEGGFDIVERYGAGCDIESIILSALRG